MSSGHEVQALTTVEASTFMILQFDEASSI